MQIDLNGLQCAFALVIIDLDLLLVRSLGDISCRGRVHFGGLLKLSAQLSTQTLYEARRLLHRIRWRLFISSNRFYRARTLLKIIRVESLGVIILHNVIGLQVATLQIGELV